MANILMTEEFWANSQLSIAKYYGGIKINGNEYLILDPANDLVLSAFKSIYMKLGREKFIETLKAHPEIEKPKQMRDIIKREDEK